MKLDTPHTFKAIHNNIKLIATEFDEPNYGRTLWKYNFFIDDILIENKYLYYSYGGLFSDLDNFELESIDGRYIYIPQISDSIVYDTIKNVFFTFNSIFNLNNNHFVKNLFNGNKLIIIYERGFQILNLDNYILQTVVFPNDKPNIIDIEYNQNNELLIKYNNIGNYQQHIEKYDFTNLELIK
jgi:hypothetical protein